MNGVVIVGGGLAGQRCAETLRRGGFAVTSRPVIALRGSSTRGCLAGHDDLALRILSASLH